ncbi:MAG: fluoride efflux transporter FluC, partial [Eubacteriales bacterium]
MDYLAVAIAGFLGAITRAALGKAIKALVVTVFPLGTFIINLTGCFILSFFLTLTLERLEINPKLRLAIGTGFLGAYTTFSTFAVDSINL